MADHHYVPEVEFALLGVLLDGAGDFSGVLAYVEPSHFVEPVHREVYAAIRQSHERFSTTQLTTVMKVVPEGVRQQFKVSTGQDLGGYLSRMISGTVHTAASAMSVARNVVSQWGRLEIAREASLLSEAASSPEADPILLLRDIGGMTERVGAELRRTNRSRPSARFDASLDDLIAETEAAIARGGPAGIPTGLADLDRMTGGLHRRDLILLGARPSMGKTSIGTTVSLNAAAAGYGVGFFSLEMDRGKLMARMASDLAYRAGIRIPYQDVINAPTLQHLEQLRGATDYFRTLPIWIDETPNISTAELRAKLDAMVAAAQDGGFTIDLIVVDHLLKVTAGGRYAGQRVLEVGEITGALKEMARDYGLAILLLTQLSRAVEGRDDKRPQLSDLRDSGAIEQDADVVMMLYREAYYLERQRAAAKSASDEIEIEAKLSASRNRAELLIEKQRNGRVGTVELHADLPFSHFGNLASRGYAEMHEQYRGGP